MTGEQWAGSDLEGGSKRCPVHYLLPGIYVDVLRNAMRISARAGGVPYEIRTGTYRTQVGALPLEPAFYSHLPTNIPPQHGKFIKKC
jgi:hypothetical protein